MYAKVAATLEHVAQSWTTVIGLVAGILTPAVTGAVAYYSSSNAELARLAARTQG